MAVYSASFNQDASCVAVGSGDGYRIYNCSPFGQFYKATSGAIGEVEMLFSTSLVVIVGQGDDPAHSPRRLKVVNTKRQMNICELTFPTAVLRVLLNRQRLAVVLESQIYLYNIATMKLLHTVDTIPNPHGVADLTPGGDAGVLVYPSGPLRHVVSAGQSAGSTTTGELTILDCVSLTPLNVVRAHKSPLAIAALNSDGTLLATASDRGTIVRVFSIPAGTLLYQFRRGSYTSQIYSIAFNLSSSMIVVASSTQTVHVYRLSNTANLAIRPDGATEGSVEGSMEGEPSAGSVGSGVPPEEEAPNSDDSTAALDAIVETKRKGYTSLLRRRVSKAREMLPSAVADMWEPKTRDFAWFKLPSPVGTSCSVGLAPLSKLIYVASLDGSLYHYALSDQGGECKRVAEYSLES